MSSLTNCYTASLATRTFILACHKQWSEGLLKHRPTARMQRTAFCAVTGKSLLYVKGLNLWMHYAKEHFPSKENSQASSHCRALMLTGDRNAVSCDEARNILVNSTVELGVGVWQWASSCWSCKNCNLSGAYMSTEKGYCPIPMKPMACIVTSVTSWFNLKEQGMNTSIWLLPIGHCFSFFFLKQLFFKLLSSLTLNYWYFLQYFWDKMQKPLYVKMLLLIFFFFF